MHFTDFFMGIGAYSLVLDVDGCCMSYAGDLLGS